MSLIDFSWLVVRMAVGLWLLVFGLLALRMCLAVLFYPLPRRKVREQQAEIERLQTLIKDNPFCENCLENEQCAVSGEGTCAMVRVYRRAKGLRG